MKENKWFEEVCGICGQIKLVHDDLVSKFDNPCFICKNCEVIRDSFMNKMFVANFNKRIDT